MSKIRRIDDPPPDLVNLPHPGEFQIKCLSCGSTDVKIDDSLAMGSSQTGIYGSIDLVCQKCGATKEIKGF